MLTSFIEEHQLPQTFADTANEFYVPVAKHILSCFKESGAPFIVGVNGCQGSGKSTFTDFIAKYLTANYQLKVAVLSLDDFYLTRSARQTLAKEVHPLLATRGVPGTHDIALLKDVLHKLKASEQDFLIPRFDKSVDEPCDKAMWTKVSEPVDIVLFEGWCWGVAAQKIETLIAPINKLEVDYDQDAIWRTFVNDQLKEHYQPLYELMQLWVVLQAPSFDCVHNWRLEQEQKLITKLAANGTSEDDDSSLKVMDSAQVERFIQHFQRLTEVAIATLPDTADIAITLEPTRKISNLKIEGA